MNEPVGPGYIEFSIEPGTGEEEAANWPAAADADAAVTIDPRSLRIIMGWGIILVLIALGGQRGTLAAAAPRVTGEAGIGVLVSGVPTSP